MDVDLVINRESPETRICLSIPEVVDSQLLWRASGLATDRASRVTSTRSQQRLFAECKFLVKMGEPHVRRLAIETTARTTDPSSLGAGQEPPRQACGKTSERTGGFQGKLKWGNSPGIEKAA